MKYAARKRIKDACTDSVQPHDMDTNLVLANDQAAINAIRAVGAYQL